jgi:hypothetical protein
MVRRRAARAGLGRITPLPSRAVVHSLRMPSRYALLEEPIESRVGLLWTCSSPVAGQTHWLAVLGSPKDSRTDPRTLDVIPVTGCGVRTSADVVEM